MTQLGTSIYLYGGQIYSPETPERPYMESDEFWSLDIKSCMRIAILFYSVHEQLTSVSEIHVWTPELDQA